MVSKLFFLPSWTRDQLSLCICAFQGMLETSKMERLPLPSNIRSVLKGLPGTNALAYLDLRVINCIKKNSAKLIKRSSKPEHLCLASKARTCPSRIPSLPSNIIPVLKGLPGTNALAYLALIVINDIKPFFYLAEQEVNKARTIVPCKQYLNLL